MMSRFSLLTSLCSAMALAGCLASAPLSKENYGKYVAVDFGKAEIMPSEAELAHETIKVVVYPADEGNNPRAREANAGVALSNAIETVISGRSIEVVDNSIALKLKDVLRVAESNGNGSYSGPKVANFAIQPVISTAEYGVSYSPASSYTDKKGRVNHVPASYSHSAKVTAAVKVYEVPSLRLVKTFNVDGRQSESGQQGGNSAIAVAMIRAAAVTAIQEDKEDILNLFSGKGYVESKKAHDKEAIFRVTLGTQQGLKPGDKVAIYSQREERNALTGKSTIEEVLVAHTTVTSNITENSAWVQPDDMTKAARILQGDVARLEHRKGFMGDLRDKLKGR